MSMMIKYGLIRSWLSDMARIIFFKSVGFEEYMNQMSQLNKWTVLSLSDPLWYGLICRWNKHEWTLTFIHVTNDDILISIRPKEQIVWVMMSRKVCVKVSKHTKSKCLFPLQSPQTLWPTNCLVPLNLLRQPARSQLLCLTRLITAVPGRHAHHARLTGRTPTWRRGFTPW